MKAHILADIEKKKRYLHKKQIMRLLIAEGESNEEVTLALEDVGGLKYVTMTKSEAINLVMEEVEPTDTSRGDTISRVNQILDERLEDIRDIWDDEPGDRGTR